MNIQLVLFIRLYLTIFLCLRRPTTTRMMMTMMMIRMMEIIHGRISQ